MKTTDQDSVLVIHLLWMAASAVVLTVALRSAGLL
jgi:hypothetical protein